MKYFEDYKIDGYPMLVPDANVQISQDDLDASGSGRDEQGYMHRIVLRRKVKKWGFNYSTLTEQEYNYMCNLLDKAEFEFVYKERGETKTTRAYSSTNKVSLFNATKGIYKRFSFNIIEC